MTSKWNFRLSGTGGQGVIKAAVILAEAALLDGRNAAQSQVYGPESRGSATRAEVQISDEDILFPKVLNPNFLLCLSQKALDKFSNEMHTGGTLLADQHLDVSHCRSDVTVMQLPLISVTREKTGNDLSVNVVALGAINAITHAVSDKAMEESIARNFKEKIVARNIEAYHIGKNIVSNDK